MKRIHEYKRQLLNIVETVALYDQIRSHPERNWTPRVKIFAGKAAPSYHNAKMIIKLANDVARRVNSDPSVDGLLDRIVSLAKRLQSGRLDAYLLYMLIALIAVIAVATALA